jgi:hypothetical protein
LRVRGFEIELISSHTLPLQCPSLGHNYTYSPSATNPSLGKVSEKKYPLLQTLYGTVAKTMLWGGWSRGKSTPPPADRNAVRERQREIRELVQSPLSP